MSVPMGEQPTEDRIRKYYAAAPEKEWQRLLDPGDGAIEFEMTKRAIRRHVPAGSRVLDIGGGPGRYAVWMAGEGHRVVLADVVPELLDVARSRIAEAGVGSNVEDVVTANACDLSRWPDGSFDAAISLGPFYHMTDESRREQAARELERVVRPGGVLLAAFMPRLMFLRRSMVIPEEWRHLRDPEFVRAVLEDGVFLNDNPGRFDAGYGADPAEVGPFFERHGFDEVELRATESVSPPAYAQLVRMAEVDPESYAAALDVLEATGTDRSILGAANHLLYVGRKR